MGRRRSRRRRIVRPKRKLPSVFQCPSCGYVAVSVSINRGSGDVKVVCSHCGLSYSFEYNPYFQPVDYYSKFLDKFEELGGVGGEGREVHLGEA